MKNIFLQRKDFLDSEGTNDDDNTDLWNFNSVEMNNLEPLTINQSHVDLYATEYFKLEVPQEIIIAIVNLN